MRCHRLDAVTREALRAVVPAVPTSVESHRCDSIQVVSIGPMVARHLHTLVARGNTSDVYRWGRHAVVKVLRPGIPDDWAQREAATTESVHAAGLPAPGVLDVTTIDGRPAIVFERIDGVSMWARMLTFPGDIPRLSLLLAELQAEVNATAAPAGIPSLHDRLHDNLVNARHLSSSERDAAALALERRPRHGGLCHFDIHPNNVLMGPLDPVIIDWFDASAGSPEADIARSSVLMRRSASHGHLECADPSVIELVHDEYLAAVLRTRHVDDEALLAWEPSVLAGRLAEPVIEAIQTETADALRLLEASLPTALSAGLRLARSSLSISRP